MIKFLFKSKFLGFVEAPVGVFNLNPAEALLRKEFCIREDTIEEFFGRKFS